MNCKPGDLAVIVSSYRNENIGALVKVIRPSEVNSVPIGSKYEAYGTVWVREAGNFCWEIEAKGRPILDEGGSPHLVRSYADFVLRPIRDNDGEDESLTWKDVPHRSCP